VATAMVSVRCGTVMVMVSVRCGDGDGDGECEVWYGDGHGECEVWRRPCVVMKYVFVFYKSS